MALFVKAMESFSTFTIPVDDLLDQFRAVAPPQVQHSFQFHPKAMFGPESKEPSNSFEKNKKISVKSSSPGIDPIASRQEKSDTITTGFWDVNFRRRGDALDGKICQTKGSTLCWHLADFPGYKPQKAARAKLSVDEISYVNIVEGVNSGVKWCRVGGDGGNS